MPETISQKPRCIPVSYYKNSAYWFTAVRHLPNAVWLDSGRPQSTYGRFDIISAAPHRLLIAKGATTLISDNQNNQQCSLEDPFLLVKSLLGLQHPGEPFSPDLPFVGGALGYFSYDLGRRLERLPSIAHGDIDLPEMRLGIYPWAIVQDHQEQRATLVINEALIERLGGPYDLLEIEHLCTNHCLPEALHDLKSNLNKSKNSFKISDFQPNINFETYQSSLQKIQGYIAAGDCYQVNFAQRFSATFSGDPLIAYAALRDALPSPFSGFMQFDQGAVLSLSPERFIRVRGTQVETKPIKGTIKRGTTPEEDSINAKWLQNSPKNRAENVMIVDLLRNDLSRHCKEVRVPALCELQTFANVHHLVSTVTGTLAANASAIEVLRDAFPGGSITGAPKIRAMEIIEELEPTRRSLYCGSLGYISADGQMDSNIAIRTLVCDGNWIHCWGGGGIVADSETDQEYRESIAKVKVLMETLGRQFHS